MNKKITVVRNEKVLKVPKRNIPQYVSTEVADVLERAASDNNVGKNAISEYALRKVFGMDTKFTDIKEVILK